MNLLLIEDDPSFTSSIEMVFRAEHYVCHTTASGVEGIKLGKSARFDIIILDLMLPDTDGFEVMRELRFAGVRTPILVLSGLSSLDDKIRAFGCGADDYVTKPFDRKELIARVRTIIARSKSRGASSLAPNGEGGHGWTPATVDPEGEWRSAAKQGAPRKAKIVVLGNHKGGTGKTTTAIHLITSLLYRGYKVGSIDLSAPQGTLTRFLENRRVLASERAVDLLLPEHFVLGTADPDLSYFMAVLNGLRDRCDYVVIDTPSGDGVLSRLAHAYADILITPINDSLIDLEAIGMVDPKTLKLVQTSHYGLRVGQANEQRVKRGVAPLQWIVLVNRVSDSGDDARPEIARALNELSVKLGFEQGPCIKERQVYRKLFLAGLTLLDLRREDTASPLQRSSQGALKEIGELIHLLGPAADRRRSA